MWWSWALAAVGIIGLYLAGRRKTAGWIIGLAAQLLWVAYATATTQYGFYASAAAYAGVYSLNWWRWTRSTGDVDTPTTTTPTRAGSAPVWLSLPGDVTLDATRVTAVRDVGDVGDSHTLVYLDSGAAVPVAAPRHVVLQATAQITTQNGTP